MMPCYGMRGVLLKITACWVKLFPGAVILYTVKDELLLEIALSLFSNLFLNPFILLKQNNMSE